MSTKAIFFILLNLISWDLLAKPIIIAHRGASGYVYEHSLEALTLAHGFNVDYIEPDLVLTRDNQLIVLHDIYLDSTTNVAVVFPKRKRKDGRYYAIDYSLKEIKQLNLKPRSNFKTKKVVFPNRYSSNIKLKVPSFLEFITHLDALNKSRNTNIGLYPELKSPFFHKNENKDMAHLFLNFLNKHKKLFKNKNMFIQCFYPPTLKWLKGKVTWPLIQLIGKDTWGHPTTYSDLMIKKGLAGIKSYAHGVGVPFDYLISKEGGQLPLMQKLKEKKLIVHVYTHRVEILKKINIPEEKFFNLLFNKLKIDGIFSDFPDRVKKHLSL